MPDIFPRKGIMEPALLDVFDCPPAWSCPQVFKPGLGMRLCERRFGYLQGAIFMQNFWNFKSYSRHRNHFDVCSKQTHSEGIQVIPMERFSEVMALLVLILVKNMKWHLDGHKSLEYQFEGYWELFFDENVKNTKWHLVGHKRLKYQFEGYWEPCFKAFILFAWIMILFRMRKHCLPIQIACLWSERAWLGM